MRWLPTLPVFALLLCCAPLSLGAQSSKPRIVLTEKDAYGILPPEVICGPVARRFTISDDGRNIVTLRERLRAIALSPAKPVVEKSLVFWETKGRTPVTIWKADAEGMDLAELAFLPQTDTAFALVRHHIPPAAPGGESKERTVLLRITSQFDRAQEIDLTEGTDQFMLYVSPVQPLAVLRRYRNEVREFKRPDGKTEQVLSDITSFHVVRRNGRPGPAIALPKEYGHSGFQWTSEGNPILRCLAPAPEGGKVELKWLALDVQQNKLTLLDKPLAESNPVSPLEAQVAKLPLRLKTSRVTAQESDTTENVSLLWLESKGKTEAPRALLAGDASGGTLLPRADGVLYMSQESLLFAPLFRMDKQAYELARRAADKAVAISNAKQLGVGLMMYAADYDEEFPTGENINDKIQPYIKNESLLQGFNYTYGGGKLSDIPNPAETILGHVLGPGGRAVLYADGHVKWKSD